MRRIVIRPAGHPRTLVDDLTHAGLEGVVEDGKVVITDFPPTGDPEDVLFELHWHHLDATIEEVPDPPRPAQTEYEVGWEAGYNNHTTLVVVPGSEYERGYAAGVADRARTDERDRRRGRTGRRR